MATPRLCSIPNCDKAVFSREWCYSHWVRWRRHGDPLAGRRHRVAPGGTCSASNCDAPATRHGFCSAHYTRLNRHGNAEANVRLAAGSGLAWIDANSTYTGDDCLLWPFSRDSKGYGGIKVGRIKTGAHRMMCIAANGEPPSPKHQAAHSCGNGHMGCCNPRHLEWKTKRQNENDKILHGTLLRGSKIGNSRLTETDVLAIRAMVRVTSQSEVAKAFGIAQATVSAIQRRIIWGWLP